jgi:hypothetical protein
MRGVIRSLCSIYSGGLRLEDELEFQLGQYLRSRRVRQVETSDVMGDSGQIVGSHFYELVFSEEKERILERKKSATAER